MGLMWRKDPEQGLNSADHPPCGSDLASTRRGQAPFQLRPGFLGQLSSIFGRSPSPQPCHSSLRTPGLALALITSGSRSVSIFAVLDLALE